MKPWLAGSLATWLITAPVSAATFVFEGTATGDNGNTLYTEHHAIAGECQAGVFRPEEHQAEYRKPGTEAAFAEKHLSFPESVLTPVVDFSQPDFNERMSITYPRPDRVAIEWRTPFGGREQFSVDKANRLVVDSGFDHLIRREWQALNRGDSVNFRFLGPTRGEHYGFVAEPVTNREIDAHLVVKLRPTSMLLRVLVDPIVLGYNREGALTDYLGLTNIRRNEDSNYTAHIRYNVTQYPPCALAQ